MRQNERPEGNDPSPKNNDTGYVTYFYNRFKGRASFGIGYNQNLTEIYPFIFKNSDGNATGMVGLGVVPGQENSVHIYHLGAFVPMQGDGSEILGELCRKADQFKIHLTVSPVFMPNGKDPHMAFENLVQWYERFGFSGDAGMIRKPLQT